MHQRLVDHRRQWLAHAFRARRMLFLNRFLLRGADLPGVGFDLLQVRRPFDLDRYRRSIAGNASGGWLRSNWLLRLEFPHRFPLVSRGRRRRLVSRRTHVLHGLGNCGRGSMMRALCLCK